MEDIIKVEGVAKGYAKHQVLQDLNLGIKKGECFTLLGPSGCGKTVLIRLIAGHEVPDAGKISIDDTVVADSASGEYIPPERRGLGIVFQDYAVWPHMTVYENIAYPLKMEKRPKEEIDKLVMDMVEVVGMKGLEKRLPSELSGGQQQRVALARALVADPSVMLLDEPLSNLDAKLRTEMRARIAELHRELGTTFVYVTHDQTEAMTMADRIVVMLDGKIQQADTPAQLYAHPCNVFVAGFIGTPPMNILPGRLVRRGNALALEVLGTEVALPRRLQNHAKLLTYVDRDVLLGLRAEDLSTDPAWLNITDPAAFRVQVEMAERMGAETYLYADLQGRRVIARVPGTVSFPQDDQTVLYPNMEALHLNDPETEVCICD